MEFVKEGCHCSRPVFDPKYLRTHRAGSVKLIRCFPHCCPTHSFANFCTSSIALNVAVPDGLDPRTVAFLKFQSTTDPVHECGDRIQGITDIRTSDNVKGEWIPSETAPTVSTTPNGTRVATFRFNHVHNVGWHYGWMGTSTKAHRTSPHHLVAYVVRPFDPTSAKSWVVEGVLTSPSFIVMSYRRACYTCQKHRNTDDKTAVCECEGEFNVSAAAQANLPHQTRPLHPTSHGDAMSWTMENDLRAVFRFILDSPILVFSRHFQAIEKCFIQLVLGHHPQPRPSILAGLLESSHPHHPPSTGTWQDVEFDRLVGSVVECIVNGMTMALSSDHRSHFAHYATFLFDKPALIDSYNHWMQSWATRLNHRLASSFQTSVAEIARAVAQRLTPSRPNMDGDEEQDSFTQSIGVEYFVAQLREVYLGKANELLQSSSRNSNTGLDGLWSFARMTQLTVARQGAADLSLVTVLRWMSMLYVMDIGATTTETGPLALHVRSPVPLYDTIWSTFTLDGSPRIFRAFPNGESTMTNMSGYIHGDYVAYALPSTQDTTVEVQIFSWPLDTALAYVTRCRVTVVQGSQQLSLDIQVCRFPVEASLDWSTMTCIERCSHHRRDLEAVVVHMGLLYLPLQRPLP
ncbi:hypothetical protein H310_04312 [Aphanomyces invadans]|uniref:Uncharacterized protein n=1 Tax=Aphanomyces invadans TaxID=157072 RepID=A0A024UDD5_9STRA|nr:hypothetical protein H310_04312 [Aphanomyces invadans]ETW03882.1 hypothetical protein H310_04312 [Aphanomyces invadans]|eukprot:XP_008866838.1 hypothetical protein H310_04312 [Aphanomyces invadans]